MKLGNIFKRKKPSVSPPTGGEKKPPEKVKKTEEPKAPKLKTESKFRESYKIIKTPHVTEKATLLSGKNQYIFKVWPRANKIEIKKAIEKIFGVEVRAVKIINVAPKKRRLGKIEGEMSGYKKAIVKIKEGQKIEVLPR